MSLHRNLQTTTDFVSDLPNEISEMIFSDFPAITLLNCRGVSKSWKQIFFKNWMLTGSKDGTIKVWDNETFRCFIR